MTKEILIGISAGVFFFLVTRGFDPAPFLLLGGFFLILRFYLQGRGLEKNYETIETAGGKGITPPVTFADIGGQEVAKRELMEALNFLKDEEKVKDLGIRPLKGILLSGPPGTGKTLMAKAAAAYTDSVFLAASGSEFIEMYAGVGAQRVRQLFARARKLAKKTGKQKAIIFLDELEVLGGKRGKHSSHLEYDQTLNQLLVEMDGVKAADETRILVVGATNRADLLDEALMRPGRFDRRVQVDLPEKDGRLKILQIHTRNKPLAAEVNLETIAEDTFGFSGAHLEAMVNEAAILAFRQGKKEIGKDELEEAIDKVILGEKLERKPQRDELRRIAIHETGHALISETVRPNSVSNVTVAPRGKALGFVRPNGKNEHFLYTREDLEDQIAVFLGGAVAEELVYGDRSTGARNDLEQTVKITREIIKNGLSPLGIVDEEYTPKDRINSTFTEIIHHQEERVRKILTAKLSLLEEGAERLLAAEKISGEEFRNLMKQTA
ncbi:MAG TPA: AAA family ATPase [Firmicutes bacterium]|jgi:cell division protease FtsH|nr:AAA family ATPase [Bacillota bacterium]